jgi:hypothetical protein
VVVDDSAIRSPVEGNVCGESSCVSVATILYICVVYRKADGRPVKDSVPKTGIVETANARRINSYVRAVTDLNRYRLRLRRVCVNDNWLVKRNVIPANCDVTPIRFDATRSTGKKNVQTINCDWV